MASECGKQLLLLDESLVPGPDVVVPGSSSDVRARIHDVHQKVVFIVGSWGISVLAKNVRHGEQRGAVIVLRVVGIVENGGACGWLQKGFGDEQA